MSFKNLKLGAKLGLGFGIVGVLFMIVVFQYQKTLTSTIHGFEEVLNINEQIKSLVTNIGSKMHEMRSHEKDFLLTQDLKYVEYVEKEEAETKFNLSKLPSDAIKKIRIIKIGEYDACPCSGLHVLSTKEIGKLKIISTDFNEGILRIRFKLLQQN